MIVCDTTGMLDKLSNWEYGHGAVVISVIIEPAVVYWVKIFTSETFELLLVNATVESVFTADSFPGEILVEYKTDKDTLVVLMDGISLCSTEFIFLEVDVTSKFSDVTDRLFESTEVVLFHDDVGLDKLTDCNWLETLEETGDKNVTKELRCFIIGAIACPLDIEFEKEEVFITIEEDLVVLALFELSTDEL